MDTKISSGLNAKNTFLIAIAAIIIAGGSFYGGIKYAENKNPQTTARQGDFQNLTPEERQQRFNQIGGGTGRNSASTSTGARQAGASFVSGQVLSKDDKSITVKLNDGGSKIIFFSDKTSILKTAEGSQADVAVGENVMINGSANSDGSVTAQSIQIRPKAPPANSGAK